VITHHAPIENPRTKHAGSMLQPAFVCYDMRKVLEKYQPDIWIYGHTHECDAQTIGKTKVISNQLGYFDRFGYNECFGEFDEYGCILEM
jgi:Icc-related predicted phosphoesterase